MVPIKNLWRYFPGYKGTVTGLIVCALGCSGLFFNALIDFYMNPERESIKKIGDLRVYSKEIATRVGN